MSLSDAETSLISLIFSYSIFQLLSWLYPWNSGFMLLDSLTQLIWQVSIIMIVYDLAELEWIGKGQEGDFFEEAGGELIIMTGLIMILMSLGTLNMMMEQAPLF